MQHGKDYFETLPEELIIKIVAQSSLSTRQRAQAMCVSKAWRKLGLENWIGVDLDTVADYQMPLVLKFVDRLGLHSAERLQHISFPYTAASQVRVPGEAYVCIVYARLFCLCRCSSLSFRCNSRLSALANNKSYLHVVCWCSLHYVLADWCIQKIYPDRLPQYVAGYLDYWHFKALTSLDFGITPPEMRESGPFCWALCPKEIQSLSSLKNLKRLVSEFTLISTSMCQKAI